MKKIFLVLLVSVMWFGCSSDMMTSDTNYKVRRNLKEWTSQEKADYVAAVLAMKRTVSPYNASLNYYDQFVKWHLDAFLCTNGSAHMGPAFLPWHRQFLLLYEKALSDVSGGKVTTVPYWDWTDPASLSVIFDENFMGGGGDSTQNYAVTTGPFRKGEWTLTILDPYDMEPIQYPWLTRGFGTYTKSGYPTSADISSTLNRPNYDAAPWNHRSDTDISFRNYLEGWRGCFDTADCILGWMAPERCASDTIWSSKMHNVVHLIVGGVWNDSVGGTITAMTSPNDPVFFLLHANVDRMWAAWEARHPKNYEPITGGPVGHNLRDKMWPYTTIGMSVTPESMLDTKRSGYVYDTMP
jgi:tyrosinase